MRYLVILVSLLASACASTLPEDFVFDTSEGEALLVFDQSIAGTNGTLILTPADLETQEFVRLPAQLTAGFRNRIDGSAANASIYVESVDPGVYVVSGVRYMNGTGGSTTRCYSLGTAAINIEAGRINILSSGARMIGSTLIVAGPGVDPANRITAIQSTLSEHPGIPADLPLVAVERLANVRFEPGIRLVGPRCPGNSRFEIINTTPAEASNPGTKPKSLPVASSD